MSIKTERAAIERTYNSVCYIYEFKKVKENNITTTVKTLVSGAHTCALSQVKLNNTNQSNTVNYNNYTAKLFIAPEIEIPPGSHIEIFKNHSGRRFAFKASGECFDYETHQEIMLLRDEKA